jgi:hypothetical protein
VVTEYQQNCQNDLPPNYPIEFRACLSSYIVFGVILGGLLALYVWALLARGLFPNWWWPISILTSCWVWVYFVLSRYRLRVDETSVSYSSLLVRNKKVERAQIAHADFAEVTGPLEGLCTFVVSTTAGEELRINAKVFSMDAVRMLCALHPAGRTARP